MTYQETFDYIKGNNIQDILDETAAAALMDEWKNWTLSDVCMHIANNNKRNYGISPVAFHGIVEEGDKTYLIIGDMQKIPISDTPERIQSIKEHREYIRTAIALHPENEKVILLSFGSDNTSADEEMKDTVIKDMIKALDIHTKGRLKVLFKEAVDEYTKWLKGYQKYGELNFRVQCNKPVALQVRNRAECADL